MILVTGATGTIGSEVLRLLARRGVPLRAMSRDPSRLRLPTGPAAELSVARADFDDPGSLRGALTEVTGVFLATAPGGRVPAHDAALIEAAAATDVRKVVKLSAIGTGEHGTVGQGTGGRTSPAEWHEPGERGLAASGLAWSVLRPTGFASNALRWADAIRSGGSVPNMTGTGAMAVVDPRDVAEAAVQALLAEDHDGSAHTLTGPEPVSVPDQAAQLAEVLGQPVGTVDVPPDEARGQMLAAGLDRSVVEVARERADQSLADALSALPDPPAAGHREEAELAAWSMVHGFAALWLSGALPGGTGADPGAAARPVIRQLFEPG